MAIFTRRFANADEYEEFLESASGRVNVLEIVKPPTVYGSNALPPAGPVTLRYQTSDKAFAPPKTTKGKVVEYAVVGAAFFALFAYLIAEL
jgi:hypothetical protein